MLEALRELVGAFRVRRLQPGEAVRAVRLPLGLHRPAVVLLLGGGDAVAVGAAGAVVGRLMRAAWLALLAVILIGGPVAIAVGYWALLDVDGVLSSEAYASDAVSDVDTATWLLERLLDAVRIALVVVGVGAACFGFGAARAERAGPDGGFSSLGTRLDEPENEVVVEAARFRAGLIIFGVLGVGILGLGLTGDAPGWLRVILDARYVATGG